MLKEEKERVVAELTERLRTTQTLIVADYRGLTNAELESLRGELIKHGARFAIVKNTLTRIAAEAAEADALLALLEGPTAIAFLEADGDPVAVAKALADTARNTRVLAVRGGILEGRAMSAEEVESLGKLPPLEVLRGQVLGAVTAPLMAVVGLIRAPLQELYGLIDARIAQLGDGDWAGDSAGAESPREESVAAAAVEEAPGAEVEGDVQAEPSAETVANTISDSAPAESHEEA